LPRVVRRQVLSRQVRIALFKKPGRKNRNAAPQVLGVRRSAPLFDLDRHIKSAQSAALKTSNRARFSGENTIPGTLFDLKASGNPSNDRTTKSILVVDTHN
jgi:hypothetical protein